MELRSGEISFQKLISTGSELGHELFVFQLKFVVSRSQQWSLLWTVFISLAIEVLTSQFFLAFQDHEFGLSGRMVGSVFIHALLCSKLLEASWFFGQIEAEVPVPGSHVSCISGLYFDRGYVIQDMVSEVLEQKIICVILSSNRLFVPDIFLRVKLHNPIG